MSLVPKACSEDCEYCRCAYERGRADAFLEACGLVGKAGKVVTPISPKDETTIQGQRE